MLRLKKNNIFKIIIKLTHCFIAIFFFIDISFAWELSWTPLNSLNKRVDSTKKDIELNSAQWKAIVKDLYTNSLKQVELLKINPMFNSVKSTTKSLNNSYLCNIKDDDTINILYKSNDSFRKELKNITSSFERPDKWDMVSSCDKLMSCVLKSNNGKTIVDSLSYCQLLVNDYYLNEYKNSYNLWSLTEGNKWLDAFRNKSLSDSSYDILNDVYVLAKILFDSAEEPNDVLFYDMPNIWSPIENMFDPYSSVVVDRYSPYYLPSGDSWWNSNPSWGSNQWGDDWNEWEWEWWPQVEWEVDYEIIEFTQTITHEVEWKEWYEFLWNDCIDWFYIEWYDGYTYEEVITWTTMTPREAAQALNDSINEMDCEYDEQCDPNSWWDSNPPEDPDWQNNPGWTSGDDQLFDDPQVQTCFSSCNSIPCNAQNCDRLACYAKCLCLTYESPFFDPVSNPWLGPVFKLKFCIQPVQEHKILTSQKVYTLESTINSLNIIIQDLRNGWQLMLNKKTRELMDAWLQNNKFSEQLSLSIDWFEKAPELRWSEKQEKENQINFNTAAMESILWFEKQETSNWNWRNKYIIKWWTIEDGALATNESQAENPSLEEGDNNEIISTLKNSHLDNMWSEVSEFLQGNLDFWQWFKDAMKSIKKTAESLLNKK